MLTNHYWGILFYWIFFRPENDLSHAILNCAKLTIALPSAIIASLFIVWLFSFLPRVKLKLRPLALS